MMRVNLGNANLDSQIQKITEPAQAAAKQMEHWNRISEALFQRHQTTTRLLIASGWPPPLNFPASGLDDLLDLFEQGEVSESELGDFFVDFYDKQQITEMLQRWESNHIIAHRVPVLSESLMNYVEGRFASCVSLVLPNLEGVIGDHVNRKPNPKNDLSTLFDSSRLDDAASEFYINAVLANFDWQEDPILGLNRHQILHGKDVNFGTKLNALKTVLLFDAFQQAVFDRAEG